MVEVRPGQNISIGISYEKAVEFMKSVMLQLYGSQPLKMILFLKSGESASVNETCQKT